MVGDKLRKALSDRSSDKDSRLILALDVSKEDVSRENIESKYLNILETVSDSIVAVKIGYPLVLKTGLQIISKIHRDTDVPIIADFKIADVPHVSQLIATYAYDAGADGVIAHAFVGNDSLEAIIQSAEDRGGKGVIVVPSMSHSGGEMFIAKFSNDMLDLAKEVGATGVIGPATRPKDVELLRSRAGEDLLILTPGIGAQGAQPGDAIRNGADYEIVGRAIYTSDDPESAAERIRNKINEVIGK